MNTNLLRFALILPALLFALGCGASEPVSTGEMTPELQAKIDAEQLAIEDDERAASVVVKNKARRK